MSEKKTKSKEKAEKPEKITESEFEKKVIELAKDGLTSEKIGEALRKQGIHSKEYGKKISRILKEKNLYVNPDLKNLNEKIERINKHAEKNRQDKKAFREITRIHSHLRNLNRYYKVPQ